jgi:hypothetical protein
VQAATGGDYVTITSPRAGGGYGLARGVKVTDLSPAEKAKLTAWLQERRAGGDSYPLITSHSLDAARALPTPGVAERRDRALEFLASRAPTLGANVRLGGNVDEELQANLVGLQLATASGDDREARTLVKFL